ncbi:protein kinase [Nocardia sp. N2S4-5]|uniref:serine/threonine-protein kinase n=1 Tax=Nocardia sp. N2S4-5 TaxID=3351565 RepID=UPI0037D364E2
MDAPRSRAGDRFGPYELRSLLGRGGMGEVYEAYDTNKDRVVALKLLPGALAEDPAYQARFRRASQATAGLAEPHVIPIHNWGEINGILYIDMRLVRGDNLRTLLRRHSPMDPDRAVALVEQVAAALDAAHVAGVVHRDVKPANILVTAADFAYLADFGISRSEGDSSVTLVGTAAGTYTYMAPERFDVGPVTGRADVYSLACVLHECLTGAPPYPSKNVSALIRAHLSDPPPRPSLQRSDVPPALDAVIAHAMAKAPDGRYATAGEFAGAARAAFGLSVGYGRDTADTGTIATPVYDGPDMFAEDTSHQVEDDYEPDRYARSTGEFASVAGDFDDYDPTPPESEAVQPFPPADPIPPRGRYLVGHGPDAEDTPTRAGSRAPENTDRPRPFSLDRAPTEPPAPSRADAESPCGPAAGNQPGPTTGSPADPAAGTPDSHTAENLASPALGNPANSAPGNPASRTTGNPANFAPGDLASRTAGNFASSAPGTPADRTAGTATGGAGMEPTTPAREPNLFQPFGPEGPTIPARFPPRGPAITPDSEASPPAGQPTTVMRTGAEESATGLPQRRPAGPASPETAGTQRRSQPGEDAGRRSPATGFPTTGTLRIIPPADPDRDRDTSGDLPVIRPTDPTQVRPGEFEFTPLAGKSAHPAPADPEPSGEYIEPASAYPLHESDDYVHDYAGPEPDYTRRIDPHTGPGNTYSQPGNAYAGPGNTYAQPDEAHAESDNTYARPGDAHTGPGNTYARPGDDHTGPDDLYARPDDPHAGPDDNYVRSDDHYARADGTYAGPEDDYARTETDYPGTDDTFPRGNDPYAERDDAYTRPSDAYTRPDDTYPGSNDAYPRSEDDYTRTDADYPGPDSTYPRGNDAYTDDPYAPTEANYAGPGDDYSDPGGNHPRPDGTYPQPDAYAHSAYTRSDANYRHPDDDYRHPQAYGDEYEEYDYAFGPHPDYDRAAPEYDDGYGGSRKRSIVLPIVLCVLAVAFAAVAATVGWRFVSKPGSSAPSVASGPADSNVPVSQPPPQTAPSSGTSTTTTTAAVPAGATECQGGARSQGKYAKSATGTAVTSCAFAEAVRAAYAAEAESGSGTPTSVVAVSPVTGRSYTMNCSPSGRVITCTGGENAVVYVY